MTERLPIDSLQIEQRYRDLVIENLEIYVSLLNKFEPDKETRDQIEEYQEIVEDLIRASVRLARVNDYKNLHELFLALGESEEP